MKRPEWLQETGMVTREGEGAPYGRDSLAPTGPCDSNDSQADSFHGSESIFHKILFINAF